MNITFVDDNDNVIGSGNRKDAYAQGIAHRIARIFLFNSNGEFLLQKRSATVDQPNLWDQSAAGHVDAGEEYEQAAYRELKEEIGIDGVPLTKVAYYLAVQEVPPELSPKPIKRFNTIYTGTYGGPFTIDPGEVGEVKWIGIPELEEWMREKPDEFTGGFKYAWQKFKEK